MGSKTRLCGLPNNVLLAIMGQAYDVTILCLRRASRVFLWLFEDDRFRHLHDNSRDRLPYSPSTWAARERVPHDAMPALGSLLQKGPFLQELPRDGPRGQHTSQESSRFTGRFLLHGQDERVAEQGAKQGAHSSVLPGT